MASQVDAACRLDHAAARAAYTAKLEASAETLAAKTLELAMAGDVSCMIALGLRLMPPAKPKCRVQLKLPPMRDFDACRDAAARIAKAVGRGVIGLDDALAVQSLVERVAEGHRQASRDAAMGETKYRLQEAGNIRLHVREIVVAGRRR